MSDAISKESNGQGFDFEAELDERDDEFEFDCGMDRNGVCGKAGSEECEFECPFNE